MRSIVGLLLVALLVVQQGMDGPSGSCGAETSGCLAPLDVGVGNCCSECPCSRSEDSTETSLPLASGQTEEQPCSGCEIDTHEDAELYSSAVSWNLPTAQVGHRSVGILPASDGLVPSGNVGKEIRCPVRPDLSRQLNVWLL